MSGLIHPVPAVIDITERSIMIAVRKMIRQWLPHNVEVIRAQVNRVPEPTGADFIIITPLMRTRLSTNIDTDVDLIITDGWIADDVLHVISIRDDPLLDGQLLFGFSILPATTIVKQLTVAPPDDHPGGTGTYQVRPPQTSQRGYPIYAGQHNMCQHTEMCYQLDVHGPASAEHAQIITTMARDLWSCDFLKHTGIQPLYANEAKQLPFINAESQYEDRYIVELHIQANPTITVAQQFAEELDIFLYNVDVETLRHQFTVAISDVGGPDRIG